MTSPSHVTRGAYHPIKSHCVRGHASLAGMTSLMVANGGRASTISSSSSAVAWPGSIFTYTPLLEQRGEITK